MSDEHDVPIGDFITSILMILFSGWVIVVGLGMRRFEPLGLRISPGFSPIVFGSLLLLCGLIMLGRSIAKRGYKIELDATSVKTFLKSRETRNFLVVLATIFVVYFLLGIIHFAVLGSLCIFFIVWYFKGVPWWKNLIISVLCSTVIWFSFEHLFLIPLP
jgi:preprotein translocase subunit SecG